MREALSAAARGEPVLPCHAPTPDGGCTCGDPRCRDPGKHPRIRGPIKNATTDKNTILRWARRWPGCNWAIVPGRAGLVILDIDRRNGGPATLEEWEREDGPLPPTPRTLTGNGEHRRFRHPGPGYRVPSVAEALGPGLDIKSDGGIVLLPGSLHASGRRYRWAEHPDVIKGPALPTGC